MPKFKDKKILNEITEMEKRFILKELKNLDVTEITHYEYQKNTGLINSDNWEKIIIIRKPKRIDLRKKEVE